MALSFSRQSIDISYDLCTHLELQSLKGVRIVVVVVVVGVVGVVFVVVVVSSI